MNQLRFLVHFIDVARYRGANAIGKIRKYEFSCREDENRKYATMDVTSDEFYSSPSDGVIFSNNPSASSAVFRIHTLTKVVLNIIKI